MLYNKTRYYNGNQNNKYIKALKVTKQITNTTNCLKNKSQHHKKFRKETTYPILIYITLNIFLISKIDACLTRHVTCHMSATSGLEETELEQGKSQKSLFPLPKTCARVAGRPASVLLRCPTWPETGLIIRKNSSAQLRCTRNSTSSSNYINTILSLI